MASPEDIRHAQDLMRQRLGESGVSPARAQRVAEACADQADRKRLGLPTDPRRIPKLSGGPRG